MTKAFAYCFANSRYLAMNCLFYLKKKISISLGSETKNYIEYYFCYHSGSRKFVNANDNFLKFVNIIFHLPHGNSV